jgi:hypothetical protein
VEELAGGLREDLGFEPEGGGAMEGCGQGREETDSTPTGALWWMLWDPGGDGCR